jgi:hypothetical protein
MRGDLHINCDEKRLGGGCLGEGLFNIHRLGMQLELLQAVLGDHCLRTMAELDRG